MALGCQIQQPVTGFWQEIVKELSLVGEAAVPQRRATSTLKSVIFQGHILDIKILSNGL